MPETLLKLSPHRDLQCYFERPSAIAALSSASPTGFVVSGTWRQQFDWAVIEWNQHNVFEHPAFRNLPDGDLSGLHLTYDETRNNCIPIDSDLYATVDWPSLRIWTPQTPADQPHKVSLKRYASPIEGSYSPASARLELDGSPEPGTFVGVSFLDEHHTYQVLGADSLEDVAQAIAASVNAFSSYLEAERDGTRITFYYVGIGQVLANSTTGSNGNRMGIYGFTDATATIWAPSWAKFSGGTSPTKWRISLNFANLRDQNDVLVPTTAVRKMRWTYAADLQDAAYQRSEFSVEISNWTVTGANRPYSIAAPSSQRFEDDDSQLVYSGTWGRGVGNFSGGTIRFTAELGASVRRSYYCSTAHRLYVGSRIAANGAPMRMLVDSLPAKVENLGVPGEDTLVRVLTATLPAGHHTVTIQHAGGAGQYLYFDFFEAAIPTTALPQFQADSTINLATDWDTDHSIAIAAERSAWMIHSLGFHGRVNHYVGALWFYELTTRGFAYAFATVDFTGTPAFSQTTTLVLGRLNTPGETVISHVTRAGDTAETIALSFALQLNRGYTAIWAEASGNRLTIHARALGEDGNYITVAASSTSTEFVPEVSGPTLSGGVNGQWRTDIHASPRLNRAVRDWSHSFYARIRSYGMDVVAAFSTELQHGDPSVEEGIAQRCFNGQPAMLNTPALQTNFSPTSLAYWREVYREMAALQAKVGAVPFMQFGEVQWWYFPPPFGDSLPFYDEYTTTRFQATYGRPLAYVANGSEDPAQHPEEAEFLPLLIGEFTAAIMAYVRTSLPNTRFEVLYPTDVNDFPFTRVVNYPGNHWTPATLDNLKTESFTFTFLRDLNLSRKTVDYGATRGFPPSKRSFLVGIGDAISPWKKEVEMAKARGLSSIVLFALDQYCLVGYDTPVSADQRRAAFMG